MISLFIFERFEKEHENYFFKMFGFGMFYSCWTCSFWKQGKMSSDFISKGWFYKLSTISIRVIKIINKIFY